MIKMAKKKSEEKSTQGIQKQLPELRWNFWKLTLDELRKRRAQEWDNRRPSKLNYLQRTAEVSNCKYRLHIIEKEASVDLYLEWDPHENEWIFDRLKEKKQKIKERFGDNLNWLPPDGSKHRKIRRSEPFDVYNEKNWPEVIEWLCENIVKLEEAFAGPLVLLGQELESQGAASVKDS